MNPKAILALYPEVKTVLNHEDGTVEVFGEDNAELSITIDEAVVNAWADPEQYARDRAAEYPSIGDQLDALFHAGVFPAGMAATIQAVKDKYPKGGA